MKKIILLFSIIFVTLIISSCGMELNKRTFVEIMGIEKENNLYKVSLQLYRPHDSAGNFDITGDFDRVLSGEGITISSALSNAELKQGKELFLGHTKLLIIGENIIPAREFQFLVDQGISPGCPVICSSSVISSKNAFTPNDVILSNIGNGGDGVSGYLLELMDSSIRHGQTVYTSVMQISRDNTGLDLPCLLAVVSDDLSGKAYFNGLTFAQKNNTPTGNIHPYDITGVKLLLDDYTKDDGVIIPVSINGKTASAVLVNSKTRKSAVIYDDQLRVLVYVTSKIRILENPYGLEDDLIEEAVRHSLHDMIISAYSTAVWYNKNDVFGIYKLIRQQDFENLQYYTENSDWLLEQSLLDVQIRTI